MKIQITGPGTFKEVFGDSPEVGKKYYLEEAEFSSREQIAAAKSLTNEYFNSGCFSDDVDTAKDLDVELKKRIGGMNDGRRYDWFVWWNPEDNPPVPVIADSYKKIPKYIRDSEFFDSCTIKHPRSHSLYTKDEMSDYINSLICEMEQTGVNTPRYRKIRKIMEERSNAKWG